MGAARPPIPILDGLLLGVPAHAGLGVPHPGQPTSPPEPSLQREWGVALLQVLQHPSRCRPSQTDRISPKFSLFKDKKKKKSYNTRGTMELRLHGAIIFNGNS